MSILLHFLNCLYSEPTWLMLHGLDNGTKQNLPYKMIDNKISMFSIRHSLNKTFGLKNTFDYAHCFFNIAGHMSRRNHTIIINLDNMVCCPNSFITCT
jgi:hypothetical protein